MVGKDKRSSSDKIFNNLVKGITDSGADVLDIGYCSTPLFYYSCVKYDSGVMVTASHNPSNYNGLKFCREKAIPISYDSGLNEVKQIIFNNSFKLTDKPGKVVKKDFMQGFIEHNLKFVNNNFNSKIKITIDAANGMAGLTYPAVFSKIKGVEVNELYFDIDMTFPNHEANPLIKENLKDLQNEVVNSCSDLGAAVDGDCDRVIFVDENGEVISSDLITALVAKELLEKKPGSTVLYDLRSSKVTAETIEENNGKAVMCRVGHSYIKELMRKHDAIFAGELSGHFYYKDSFYTESSIITIIHLINILRKHKKPISELIKPLKRYYSSGEINFVVKNKPETIKNIVNGFSNTNVTYLDGARVEGKDFWFNVRASNTEDLLRLNIEAISEERLVEVKKKIIEIINKTRHDNLHYRHG